MSRSLITFGVVIGLSACGTPQEDKKEAAVSATTAGNCIAKPGEGCIGGFISHGTAITVSLADSNEKVKFRDAADLYDRFSEAFVEPTLKAAGRAIDDYDITLEPEIKRDNFAIGFYQFLEGTKAYDKKTITSEGNFSYAPIDSGTYLYRMVKEITLIQKPKSDGESVEQCLVFEFQKENIIIDVNDPASQIGQLGGVNEFQFYARRNYGKCTGSKDLPTIGPALPNDQEGTSTDLAIIGSYPVTGINQPTDLTLVNNSFYLTTADCTNNVRVVTVFDKSTQELQPSLNLPAPCGSPTQSLASQGDHLYFLSGTMIAPAKISTAAAETVVDIAALGYTSGQLSGGLVDAGVLYALEAKDFHSGKIVAVSLTGTPVAPISLSGHDQSQLVGLAKIGSDFFSAKISTSGETKILKISATGALTATYGLTGLDANEKLVALEGDGTSLWIATDKVRIAKLGVKNEK